MTMNKEVAELPSMLIQRWRAEAAAHEKRAEELSYGYPLFAHDYEKKAEQKKECAAQLESALSASAEPVAWIRYLPDGLYEGPIHSSEFTEYFRKSGKWTPLHANAPPASCNPTTQPASVPDEVLEVAVRLIREAVPATARGQTCFVPKYVIDQLSAAISSYSTPETLA